MKVGAARKKMSYKKAGHYRHIIMRTSPGSVSKAVQILSPNARIKVIELGFEQLLYISLDAIENREIVVWLLNHCEQSFGNVVIKIGEKILVITENVVAHVLGVPEGSGESLDFIPKKAPSAITEKVRLMLGLPAKVKKGVRMKGWVAGRMKGMMPRRKKGRRIVKGRPGSLTAESRRSLILF